MRVVMVGTGYVGLVSGACFSEFGFHITCVDKDERKIQSLRQGIIPIYEPGLDKIVEKNVAAGRLSFTTDLAAAVKDADIVFIGVGTPTRKEDGHADLSYVHAAAREIAHALTKYTVIVTKSTVPVGTSREIQKIILKERPSAEFDVVSNPEFLREGSAIEDFMRPNRVVVGTRSQRARDVMRQLYRPLFLLETPILYTTPESAEMIKYAANSFLATKIAFINEVSDLCEKCGADVQDVAKGIGLDQRIGSKFLHVSPGYGGSCFPKDTLALAKLAHEQGAPITIVDAVVAANDRRKRHMAERIIHACGGSVAGKKLAILGVTFKPNTDDMRDAASLDILPRLETAGAQVCAYDPVGMEAAKPLLPKITWCPTVQEALQDADCVVILTEWNEFRALDMKAVKAQLKTPLVVDLRNIYRPEEMAEMGFVYVSLGRPVTHPAKAGVVESIMNWLGKKGN